MISITLRHYMEMTSIESRTFSLFLGVNYFCYSKNKERLNTANVLPLMGKINNDIFKAYLEGEEKLLFQEYLFK